jgi:hypothetical protein
MDLNLTGRVDNAPHVSFTFNKFTPALKCDQPLLYYTAYTIGHSKLALKRNLLIDSSELLNLYLSNSRCDHDDLTLNRM